MAFMRLYFEPVWLGQESVCMLVMSMVLENDGRQQLNQIQDVFIQFWVLHSKC